MKRQLLIAFGAFLALSLGIGAAARAAVVASDNANTGGYSPQPDGNWPMTNGGSGYGNWSQISDTSGGGHYMEGVGVNGRQVDGSYSFAEFAGGGGYDISRPLASSLTAGEFDILTRFDLAGNNINLVNLRSGNNTSGFGAGELLSFGIVGSASTNELSYTDGSGLHTLPTFVGGGDARGSIWSWDVLFNAVAGTYSATVTRQGGANDSYNFSGNLEASSTSVGSFAVINTSSGGGQNLIFDSPTFSTVAVPEPSAILLGIPGLAAIAFFRRRHRRG